MSEEDQVEVEVKEEVAAVEEYDIIKALQEVLRKALIYDGLRRGLHESIKALDKGTAKLCVLSKSCDNAEYTKLVEALCNEGSIPLILADEGKLLGEWVGLAKLNTDKTVRKCVRCSVAVVTDFGEETPALNYVLEYVKSQN
mmetsp:Transcript_17435/g.15718  ORF Transcript_17435/g.15718 Transcript_17435/m.15718 type:complete len:142 (+) Transcript_17435:71-496(+)